MDNIKVAIDGSIDARNDTDTLKNLRLPLKERLLGARVGEYQRRQDSGIAVTASS